MNTRCDNVQNSEGGWKCERPYHLLALFRVWFIGLYVRAVMHDVGETTRHFSTRVREHLVT